MTPQQAFKKSALHILSQRSRCRSKDEQICLYRSPKGDEACAVGILLPKKLGEALDQARIGSWGVIKSEASLLNRRHSTRSSAGHKAACQAVKKLAGIPDGLLYELQAIHDLSRGSSRHSSRSKADKVKIRLELISLGQRFDLDVSFLG